MGWDERFTYIEHQFKAQGKVAALIIVKSRMLTKSGDRVSPQQMLELAEIGHLDTIKMDEVLETWNNSTLSHWDQVS